MCVCVCVCECTFVWAYVCEWQREREKERERERERGGEIFYDRRCFLLLYNLSIYLSIYLSLYLSIYLSIYLTLYVCTYLYIYLSLWEESRYCSKRSNHELQKQTKKPVNETKRLIKITSWIIKKNGRKWYLLTKVKRNNILNQGSMFDDYLVQETL